MSERYDHARRRGYRDEAVSDMEGHHRDRMARKAELWLCRYLGDDARLVAGTRRRDPGYDLEYADWRIDVKWTPYEPGGPWRKPTYPHLVVPAWKPRRADAFALIIGASPDRFDRYAWADGWATRAEVEAADLIEVGRKRRTSGSSAPMFWLGFDYLRPLTALKVAP